MDDAVLRRCCADTLAPFCDATAAILTDMEVPLIP